MMQDYQEIKILLVEDDDIDAKAVTRGFKKLKLLNPIVRATNGQEALDILNGKDGEASIIKPYIVLLDLNMPIMGGLEFLSHIRDDDNLQDAVIFVLTTSQADSDRVSAYKKHIAGYILKSNVGDGFKNVIDLIDQFWRVVLLPK